MHGLPRGFTVHTAPVGIEDDGRDDLCIIASQVPAHTAAVFTRSRFAGPSVTLSCAAAVDGSARGVVVVARNANVATGAQGAQNAAAVRDSAARALGIDPDELLIASTGVIGRQYPMERIAGHLDSLAWPPPGEPRDMGSAARAIMTTDTRPKCLTVRIGDATLTGIAKGVGMLEPDMATLLTFFVTDAELDRETLTTVFKRVMDVTFNAVSIDTDTSTSDSAALFANGLAGPVDPEGFEQALHTVALGLVKMIASDGEGASTLIQVEVEGARDTAQAKRVGKAVVNSPLVKTAVHGADPNWGRVVMAIGKCQEDVDIVPENVAVRFGDIGVYPPGADEDERRESVAAYLKGNDEVVIGIDLGIGEDRFTVYGCDLTEGYVRLNSQYTT
ncbi:bifunctional glutamate N-acetyltransferase/amino-acid acetyltransferase ArgJ [Streptomyces sp. A3M-1-3]|uniref:bifunctional glutamate N-acetyltransferase/amino-acid acetyltransferase ArgJ n=1 Tax=Streptomyces sp. A3M-1-3 TaxID=2962044 RepID=UPI0020B8D214|nr:bifunctional glutamate N-acetyltransferase/amino-acid acetyltransferase ArgJ [Streptomyces sp. A3M-1-3]MCP3818227.1 bifunctional glutamate N-acetyltransferase/amino-acid acetyltransferase ArgJ [Streptomyces sp. A3M-1-3]